jgi:hypothetical protein
MNGLLAGLGMLGAALAARRYGLSELGLTDEGHAAEFFHHVERAHAVLDRAENALKKRKSRVNCRMAYNNLQNVMIDTALANENLKAIQTGRSKFDQVMTDLSTDYDDLYKWMKSRCGTMILSPSRKRKCVSWSRKGKKRVCRRYTRVSAR